jgi:exopolyphosphatase/guanosine-5'-triphosphate,3'-diphosphate pyrophosphatase
MSSGSVAVIDIGSNSIKVLVATRSATGGITALATRTIDARISTGLSHSEPRLLEEGMARGLDAIGALLTDAAAFTPDKIILVATSAVRDARNGADFRRRVFAATGRDIRILSGDEEANLIGRGLTCDPALAALRDFHVFDLGGGSLECLAFREREIYQVASLQLGCVRLTEKFVRDPAQPFPADAARAIADHTRAVVAASGFVFDRVAAIGTGGTVGTARAVVGAREGRTFNETDPVIPVAALRELLAQLAEMPLAARKKTPGLPPPRADVVPAALVTLITVAEIGCFDAYRNSLYNLRFGLAAAALESPA